MKSHRISKKVIAKAPFCEEELSLHIAYNEVGDLYRGLGKLKESEDLYLRALTGTEKALGPEHALTLDTVRNLGTLYHYQSKLKEAEDRLERALTGTEKALGPEHMLTLSVVNNLGLLYQHQDRLREAEDLLRRALAGLEKTLGPKHQSVVIVRSNIAQLKNPPPLRTWRIISRLFKHDKT